ncbi:hypothetical protein SEA_SAKAI_47 [Arthrobacter phage Sakai]|nr:hypothetical protein SEA_GORPY_48 [Arthrobacter phage Gorpy]UVK61994.1 hypothetical protein SEA_SAKAI_47 [Arthrobacter phage Sakai]
MSTREEIAKLLFITDNHAAPDPEHEWEMTSRHNPAYTEYVYGMADALIAAGYRQIFDGDCGLSGIKDPDDREAAEAWTRWANLVDVTGSGLDGIAAMKQMLTELGYRKVGTA